MTYVRLRWAVGLAVVGGVLACCGWYERAGLLTPLIGCSNRDERLATVLAGLPIMSAHPDAATPKDRYSGCDTDDGFAYAGQRYQTGLSREDVMSFYRAAAAADGWHPEGGNPTPVPSAGLVVSAAAACFVKEVDGTTAYLIVNFPSDLNIPGVIEEAEDLYGIDLTGSHDGDAWC
ncbi:hypothetical protein COUCH_11590 [Couchioplanes caeruleus]|uniref:hypothetical protein n=1 Tax=Couchioplanes caeruleus TaxID=56438 RepID=UPI0020BE151E|nr:hypothetical protein [Couchioplanes caeruleus]UQU66864.1 hypothetical protein COUCH_11590 [Couchioplanes caeruleus]